MSEKPFGIIDMDGVSANFPAAACEAHGHPGYVVKKWNFFEDWGITVDEFWRVIHDLGYEFYGDLVKPFAWKDELLEVIKQNTRDFVIMSSPSNHPVGYAAKKIWCDKYLPGVKIIVGSEKHLLAKPDHVLLDDYDKNLLRFSQHGGRVITFPQPWNVAAGATDFRLEYVRDGFSWHKAVA